MNTGKLSSYEIQGVQELREFWSNHILFIRFHRYNNTKMQYKSLYNKQVLTIEDVKLMGELYVQLLSLMEDIEITRQVFKVVK